MFSTHPMPHPAPAFGYWRGLLWPVHSHELRKVLTMFLMFMCINFNYTLLRNTKDTLVVTAAGAEIIPFLKVWCVLPSAVFYMAAYSRAAGVLSKKALFRACIAPFMAYFLLFGLYIYPNREALHPGPSADFLALYLPKAFVSIYRFWSYSLFYILAELWGTVVLSVLFWGLANDCTPITEAKRIYALLGVGANFALIFAGPFIDVLTRITQDPSLPDPWAVSLRYLCTFVVASSCAILGLHWFLTDRVMAAEQDPGALLPSPASSGGRKDEKTKKKKTSALGFVEGIQFLMKDEYIMCLATLVMAYGVSINLVEVTWKNQLKHHFTKPQDYVTFMGYFSSATGLLTLIMMMFVGGNMVRLKGWGFTAQFTPWVLLITGAMFFLLVMMKQTLGGGEQFIVAAIYAGAVQNILSKSSKYSLFDPTKEMAYIPLDSERKVKGKAAIDGVGSRLGKSGGALIQQMLLVLGGTLDNITPIIAIILAVIIGGWILAVRRLEPMFEELSGNSDFKSRQLQHGFSHAASLKKVAGAGCGMTLLFYLSMAARGRAEQ